ncbi:MAG: hypothetical protein V1694_12120, partial [Candidatus Eisenbacteria bacterium]
GDRARTFPLKSQCRGGSVTARWVEDAVWEKVCEAVANPELILSQIGRLSERARVGQGALKGDLERIDKRLAAIGMEEGRMLDAYREEVISKDQLRDQIAKVSDKRTRLNEEKQAIMAKVGGNGAGTVDRDDVVHYCGMIRKRLDGLSCDFENKRRILTLLVSRVHLKGRTLRIKGIIPGGDAQMDSDRTATLSPRRAIRRSQR